jgi:PAS domain S-box-containing protein
MVIDFFSAPSTKQIHGVVQTDTKELRFGSRFLSLSQNDSLSRRLIHVSKWVQKKERPFAFFQIFWSSTSALTGLPKGRHFTLQPHPSNPRWALLYVSQLELGDSWNGMLGLESSLLDCLEDVVLVSEAEPIQAPGPRVLYVNKAFERMTGFTAQEILGQTPRILHGPGTSDRAREQLRRDLNEWKSPRLELTNFKKDGSIFRVELQINPVQDQTGWYTHWVSVQRDVSERYHQKMMESMGTLPGPSLSIAPQDMDAWKLFTQCLGNRAHVEVHGHSKDLSLAFIKVERSMAFELLSQFFDMADRSAPNQSLWCGAQTVRRSQSDFFQLWVAPKLGAAPLVIDASLTELQMRVAALGGYLFVHEESGEKLALEFALPCQMQNVAESPPFAVVHESKLPILLIDDNVDFGQTFKDLLELSGHRVVFCQNADEALDAIKNGAFSLALCDVNLGGPFKTDELIEALYTSRSVERVVVMSGGELRGDPRLQKQFASHEDLAVLSKPFEVDAVLKLIKAG